VLEDFEEYDVIGRALRNVVQARAALDAIEAEIVAGARLAGYSWAAIGECLELSRQGARKRHRSVDPPASERPKHERDLAAALAERAATPRA
jgi:hypothetical protein